MSDRRRSRSPGYQRRRSPSRHDSRKARREDLRAHPKGIEVAKPNFEPTGKLTADQLTRNGIVLKYAEPRESCHPSRKYRLHVFKGDSQISVIKLHEKSWYLFGRDPKVADVLLEHESCSKQHCVIQHREFTKDAGFGQYETVQKPYIIDLESANGTLLNGKEIESGRYYELKPKDLVNFGASTRDYIFLEEDIV